LIRTDADAVGFVLAGGQSSRMGSDKALIKLGGEPLIAHAIATLRRAGLAASIAAARSALSAFAPLIEDPGRGPLGGICSALASCAVPYAIFLSIDMPFIPSSLVLALLNRARVSGAAVVTSSVTGFVETFPVAVDRAALPALEAEQEAGNTGCLAALRAAATRLDRPFAALPVEELVQAGQVEHPDAWPPSFWFLNLNTPADLSRAERLIAEHRVI
jgi:molybdenum cofactor guanylyltransferase